jgi:8-oxo-dGTP pyrophosphatase MutT (NUDIX family)
MNTLNTNTYNKDKQIKHVINKNYYGKENEPINASTVTPLKKIDGKIWVLVGLRGVRGYWYKKLCTFGGNIDYGESPVNAGIREAWEEAGILIKDRDLKLYKKLSLSLLHPQIFTNNSLLKITCKI